MLSFDDTQNKKHLRILYADDMRELRNIARIGLTNEGHSIECVEDGQFALDRLAADLEGFDLLISDHNMPRMDGLGLVKRAREMSFAGKILIFSSELSPAVSEAYHELKVDRILFKPVFPSELRQVLADMFAYADCAH